MTNDTFYYTNYHEFDYSTFADEAYFNSGLGTLVIITTDGDQLVYTATQMLWDDFIAAGSAGRFYQQYIKGAQDYLSDSQYTFLEQREDATFNITNQSIRVSPTSPSISGNIPGEWVLPSPAEDVEAQYEYVIFAKFKNFEDAYKAFSYLEVDATEASLSKDEV